MNKCDLADGASHTPGKFLQISAHNGHGVEALLKHMAEALGEIPAAEEGLLVTSQRHRQQLEQAREHLLRGRGLLDNAMSLDLAAMEWRQAWSCLGEILGLGDVEHILDRVFLQFCIGK
jgi:tRNA modification GTPase